MTLIRWGPLGFRAEEVTMELLGARRLYAIEGWLAFSGLVLYLGVTEIVPRLRRRPERS